MRKREKHTCEILGLKGYLSNFNKEGMFGIKFHGFYDIGMECRSPSIGLCNSIPYSLATKTHLGME